MVATALLALRGDLVKLFRDIVDIESVSGNEGALADAVEQALTAYEHLHVSRDGDAVVARTDLGRPTRVVVAGHLDTVPVAGNLPSRQEGDLIYGRGTADMKGGVAVMLAAFLFGCGQLMLTASSIVIPDLELRQYLGIVNDVPMKSLISRPGLVKSLPAPAM